MKKVILVTISLIPALVFAQGEGNLTVLENFVRNVGRLVNVALPVIIGLGVLGFFWGLVKFIFAQGNEEAKVDGKRIMLWGIVTLFVMVSVWGLVRFVGNALGVGQGGQNVTIPTVPLR
ncbi:MAG: hypothetical protein Q8P21_02680 [bacterium]|nr:hypothetical protein [bacterium]